MAREASATRLLLHIDDDPLLPQGIRQTLHAEGYRWVHTSDAEEVMRLLAEQAPALVLMELELAGCDGPDLLAGIRSARDESPVLIVSRIERNSGLHGEAIALGIADFLSKPVLANELLQRIHELAPPPAQEPAEAAPAQDPAADESGEIGDRPAPELLARLHRRGASGVLALHRGRTRIAVQLRNGTPICVGGRGPLQASAEGEPAERAEAMLFETFGWRDGSWSFHRAHKLAPAAACELSAGPAELLARGALEASPIECVRERLAKHATLYVSVADPGDEPVEGAELSAEQESMLLEAAGRESLGELLDAQTFDERELYALWLAGRIELHAVPTLDLTELHEDDTGAPELEPAHELELEDEIELEDALDPEAEAETEPAPEVEPEPARAPVRVRARLRALTRRGQERAPREEPHVEPAEEPAAAPPAAARPTATKAADARAPGAEESATKARDSKPRGPKAPAPGSPEAAPAKARRPEPKAAKARPSLPKPGSAGTSRRPLEAAKPLAKPASAKARSAAPRAAQAPAGDERASATPTPRQRVASKPTDGRRAATRPASSERVTAKRPPTKRTAPPALRRPTAAVEAEGPSAEELAQSVRELAQEVLASDDFGVLGIEPDASDAQLAEGYERQRRRVPERALQSKDPELRARAERVRDRIEAAHTHLSDPERRRAYAMLRQEEAQEGEVSSSAERALEGERWFRKGKGHLQHRRHEQAAEAFGMASHLDPEEGEYLAHLGYAMYLANPAEDVVQREAMEHIANGIKRSPTREISYVYLGRIQKARDDHEAARKLFRKALQLKPDCHPALQEIRLLEMRSRNKGKGLLSRLLGS